MDAVPAIVIEPERACAAPAAAEAWVRESMRGTRSPRGEWTLRITFSSPTRVVASLEDEDHHPFAHRDLFGRTARECEGTMHAAGVWASLVLDAELLREHEIEHAAERALPVAAVAPSASYVPTDAPPTPIAVRPAPAEVRHVDVGLAATLGSGLGAPSPTYAGVSGFVFFDVWRAFSLRTAFAFASAIDDPASDRETLRVDACVRTRGHYLDRQGLQLDLCVGPESGALRLLGNDQAMHVRPLLGIGPSAGLRGDLGGPLAAEIRGSSVYEIVRSSAASDVAAGPTAPLSLRVELALSWGLR